MALLFLVCPILVSGIPRPSPRPRPPRVRPTTAARRSPTAAPPRSLTSRGVSTSRRRITAGRQSVTMLTCCSGSDASWYKEGASELPAGMQEIRGRLIIDSWRSSYAGDYFCVTFSGGTSQFGEVRITDIGGAGFIPAPTRC